MRIAVSAVGGLIAAFLSATAHAHGVVGQRSFIEPFITEDVNPKNEFIVARPEWDTARDGRAFSLGFGLEKKLSDRFSITLDSAWLDVRPRGADEPQASGADNLGVTLKYAFFVSPAHEAIVSAAVESSAPTGVRAAGAEPAWSFKPFLLYGKGAGDLPEALAYLRPLAVQGDAGYEIALDHNRTTALQHNVAIEYSIPYLQQGVRDFGIPWPLANLIADVELNFEHGAHAPSRDRGRHGRERASRAGHAARAAPAARPRDLHGHLGGGLRRHASHRGALHVHGARPVTALFAGLGWLDLAASIVLAGGLGFAALVARPAPAGVRALRRAAALLGVVLPLELGLSFYRLHTGSGIGGRALFVDVLATRWGLLWAARAAGLTVLAARPPGAAALAALWLVARSFQGHAGAHGTIPALADCLHLAAAAAWLGGLLQLALLPSITPA